jgi:hypothetical protein
MTRLLSRLLAFFAAVLALFLLVGVLLPGTWEAERSLTIPAPPDAIFPFVNTITGWERWTPWPEPGREVSGPAAGVGAKRSWDDPDYGSGSFTITASAPPRAMEYIVEVEGGSITVRGWITLESLGDETRVIWREEGDFGRNPLLGYAARSMGESQGRQFEQGLERLRALLVEGEEPSADPGAGAALDSAATPVGGPDQ